MGAPSNIERLIELGLNRYGAGDLDGALLVWEEALAIDPQNARANSYVDYVRLHYELLRSDPELQQDEQEPFGINDEPEYQIEILPGELAPAPPPTLEDSLDAGWFWEEAPDVSAKADERNVADEPPLELELEADLPPANEISLEADLPPMPEVSFEDATREYHGLPAKPALPVGPAAAPVPAPPIVPAVPLQRADSRAETNGDFGETVGTSEFKQEYTGGFSPDGTPVGFAHQETEIRKRNLGFVTPAAPAPAPAVPVGEPLAIGAAPTMDGLQLSEMTQERLATLEGTSPGEKTTERSPFTRGAEPNEDDLLAALPTPRPAPAETAQLAVSAKAATKELPDTARLPGTKAVTKDFPEPARHPARRDATEHSQAEVMLTHAPTQDFDPSKIDIGAPTRELGLRPKRPGTLSNPDDEDLPTKQSDVRAIRETASASPVDPIEARAAQILEEVDAEAPANEPKDEQTRRRIAALLERASAWNNVGETERAVAAVDLALSEDPNSALGQKLITRNRDAIMHVFQGYLGDLERQPELARPLHELQNAPISPRAAFLLSRIDGTLTIDELLDVSGMPRLEAYRHICQLYVRGILR